jgi:stalled ribosome alternative rescue factor ArfA
MEEQSGRDLIKQAQYPSLTNWFRKRVEAKRKRKGLGELKPREKNPFTNILKSSTAILTAKALFTPLDRVRIL